LINILPVSESHASPEDRIRTGSNFSLVFKLSRPKDKIEGDGQYADIFESFVTFWGLFWGQKKKLSGLVHFMRALTKLSCCSSISHATTTHRRDCPSICAEVASLFAYLSLPIIHEYRVQFRGGGNQIKKKRGWGGNPPKKFRGGLGWHKLSRQL
jgi:hypothetical protein